MLIAWSGHRPDVFRAPREAARLVRKLVSERAAEDVELICGGQRGVDQWAATAARDLGLPFHLVLPTAAKRFTSGWAAADHVLLGELAAVASTLEVVDEAGDLGPLAYDLRNEAIARSADALVVVWTGVRRGGTFHTLCAARARGIPVDEVLLEGAGGQGLVVGGRGL